MCYIKKQRCLIVSFCGWKTKECLFIWVTALLHALHFNKLSPCFGTRKWSTGVKTFNVCIQPRKKKLLIYMSLLHSLVITAITDLRANILEDVMYNRRDLYLSLTHSSALCWSINGGLWPLGSTEGRHMLCDDGWLTCTHF